MEAALYMPDIAAKLRFLQSPETYGESHRHLQCIETHMSWVFLTDKLALKLKKSVRFPFLDFTSLKAREFYCREEVRLNARMAPGVYLGVVALQWHEGVFALVPEAQLPAPGETVDWLVLMRRLPAHRALHRLIDAHQIDPKDLDELLALLGAFYRTAPAASISANDYVARFECELDLSRELLLRSQFQLRDAALAIERLGVAIDLGADLLRDRASRRRVLDGHGDLRPDHVYLLHPPVVIDCLEFNPPMRQVDPFDELAYLSLECDMAGAPWIGRHLFSGVCDALHDPAHPALICLYTAHRALLRARLAMAHLLDPQPRSPAKWPPLADRYIERALAATAAFSASVNHGRRA